MRKLLQSFAITSFLFILSTSSYSQSSKAEHIPFVHPGILMTAGQLNLMRDRINKGIEPQKSAFDTLKKDSRALKSFKPTANSNLRETLNDAQATWVQALMWSITKDEVYAENVLNIMDHIWSVKNKHSLVLFRGYPAFFMELTMFFIPMSIF